MAQEINANQEKMNDQSSRKTNVFKKIIKGILVVSLLIAGYVYQEEVNFHTDRGSEFKSYEISALLESFGIQRSLSAQGNPYDNAVAEATFKMIKTEFIGNNSFRSLSELKEQLSTYIHWFNHQRIHSTLGYLSPIQVQTKLTKQFA